MRTLQALLLALPLAAPLSASANPELRVSLQAQDEPLRVVLKRLTAGTPTVITVDPKVPDVPVRMALRDVTIDHALRLIIKQAGKNHPQLDYETAEQGFRVFFATPVAPNKAEKEDPNRFTVTNRNPTMVAPPPPEGDPGSAGGPETDPSGTPEGAPPSPGFGGPEGSPEGYNPYLIEPVAPYFFRNPLVPRVIITRGMAYAWFKLRDKQMDGRTPIWQRTDVLNGTFNSGRYGGTRVRQSRPSNDGSRGGNGGTGGFGRRPF